MSNTAEQIAEMVDMLPDNDKTLAFELVKRMVLAWDPDFTRVNEDERAEIEQARAEYARGETVSHNAINWD